MFVSNRFCKEKLSMCYFLKTARLTLLVRLSPSVRTSSRFKKLVGFVICFVFPQHVCNRTI